MIKFCSLYSGSTGNSLFIKSNSTMLLIDAGLSAKKIKEAIKFIGEDPKKLSGVMISHEHSDHIRGVGILSREFDIPIYANENTWNAMEECLGEINPKNKACLKTGAEFCIGDFCVKPFQIPHDASEPVGFNLFSKGKKITIATDIGHMNWSLLNSFESSDLLFLESNHDVEMLKVGRYPWNLKRRILGNTGHLSNEVAAKVVAYMAKRGTKRFFLGHLSKENNFPELAYQTASNILKEKNIDIKKDIFLDIALRDKVGTCIEF